jgi:DNA-binding CsgD family transcriptional regulator
MGRRLLQLDYSPREEQILRLIALGRADKEIAAALGISRKTVSTHLTRLYLRRGCHSRTEAVVSWMSRRSA